MEENLKKLEKNYEIPKKEICKELGKLLENLTLNFWKFCKNSVKFENKFGERLRVKTKEL